MEYPVQVIPIEGTIIVSQYQPEREQESALQKILDAQNKLRQITEDFKAVIEEIE